MLQYSNCCYSLDTLDQQDLCDLESLGPSLLLGTL